MGNTFGSTTVLIPGATVVSLYAIKTMSFVFHDRHNNQYDIIQKWAKFMTSKPMYVNFARLSNDRSLRHVLPPDTYYNATETIHAYTRTDQYTDQCVLVLSADQLRVFDELVAYVRGEDPASPLVPKKEDVDAVPHALGGKHNIADPNEDGFRCGGWRSKRGGPTVAGRDVGLQSEEEVVQRLATRHLREEGTNQLNTKSRVVSLQDAIQQIQRSCGMTNGNMEFRSTLVPGPKTDDVVPSSAVEEKKSPSATSDVSSAILEHRDAATAAAISDPVDFPLRTVAPDPNAVVTPWGGGDVAA